MTTLRETLLAWADSAGDTTYIIKRALDAADRAHAGVRRRNGEDYIEHPLAVALIMTEHGADLDTVTAALLHESLSTHVVEPVAHLRPRFGDVVADLVAAVDLLDRNGCVHVENVDERALQIKVADPLHNMRTIDALVPSKRRRRAGNTRDLIAPLAQFVGMNEAAAELDRLAVATLADADVLQPAEVRSTAVGTSLRALRLAAILLPVGCRDRWIVDWHGELNALPNRRERLGFVFDVLLGLPAMAVLTRRTDPR